jgi:hypothetical protein
MFKSLQDKDWTVGWAKQSAAQQKCSGKPHRWASQAQRQPTNALFWMISLVFFSG